MQNTFEKISFEKRTEKFAISAKYLTALTPLPPLAFIISILIFIKKVAGIWKRKMYKCVQSEKVQRVRLIFSMPIVMNKRCNE